MLAPERNSESSLRRRMWLELWWRVSHSGALVAVQFVAVVLSKGAVALRNPGAFGIRGPRGGRLDVVASDCRAAR